MGKRRLLFARNMQDSCLVCFFFFSSLLWVLILPGADCCPVLRAVRSLWLLDLL